MSPDLRKIYYILNKSQSRVIVEVELTSLSFSKQFIEFKQGDITQLAVTSDAIYALNKFGQLQLYRFQTRHATESALNFPEGVVPNNFCISPTQDLLALSGSISKKPGIHKNTIMIYSLQKMKPFCSTTLKFVGSITKLRLLSSPLSSTRKNKYPLLAGVTDTSFSFVLFEVREKDLRLISQKHGIHSGKL
jgi:hypothetical protein